MKLALDQVVTISTDADLQGDEWIDLSDRVTSDLDIDFEGLAQLIDSLWTKKSRLYVHSYTNELILDNPNDDNEYYQWGCFERIDWSPVFQRLGFKKYYDF